MQSVQVDGVDVQFVDEGSGPPLLLVHGFLVSHREWLSVLPTLATEYRCIVPDLPGFGASGKPAPSDGAPYGWLPYARVLAALLDKLELPKVHLAGHSMGGGIATTFAAEYPERVERLVVMDGCCFPFDPPLKAKPLLLPHVGQFLFNKLYKRSLFHDYFRNDVWSGHPGMDIELVDDYYRDFDKPDARAAAYAVMLKTVDPSDVAARVPRVTAPTLALWGGDDRIFPVAFGERLAREMPNARLTVLEGVGHAPNEERPAEAARLMIEHFQGRP